MRRLFLFFALLLLASSSVAQVGRINVVGVDSEGNGMVIPLDVEIVPGKGRILITSVPFTGVDTQHSENTAVAAALNFTGEEIGARDIIFVFNTNVTLVEGPSAGAAMSLATISALQGRPIRQDAVVSGVINEDGTISMSGSLLQKAYASKDKNLFLVGPGGSKIAASVNKVVRDEEISLNEVDAVVIDLVEYAERHWGLGVVEVENLEEASQVVFAPGAPERVEGNWSFEFEPREIEEGIFSESARKFGGEAWALLEELKKTNNATELEDAEGKLNKSRRYLEAGYEYSAANNAFLAMIDLRALQDKRDGTAWAGIYKEFGKERDVPDYGAPFHYVLGAQARYSWAKNVANLMEEEPANVNDSYFNANLVLVWKGIADSFLEEVEPSEMVFSSEIVLKADYWEERAGEEIAAADALGLDIYGAESLLNGMETERSYGWYYAAVYDGINAAGRAASGDKSDFQIVEMIAKAERSVEVARKNNLGFWAHNYLENSIVAFNEGNRQEAYAYAFMAEEFARFDMYAHGVPVVEKLREPIQIEPIPKLANFWDEACTILGRWCWRHYIDFGLDV